MSAEILGLAEILGDGDLDLLTGETDDIDFMDDEMLGARVRRAMKNRKVAGVARKPLAYREQPPTKGRQLVLGFDSAVTIAAAGTLGVSSNPQQVFAPERIAVPATLAPNFLINSLTIGTAIQFLNATGVQAETFGTTAPDVRLKMDTAQINSVITFNVTNLSGGALRFFASLIGPSVK